MPDYEIVLKKIQAAAEDPNCRACQGLKYMQSQTQAPEDVFIKRVEAQSQPPFNIDPTTRAVFFMRSRPTSEGFPIEDALVPPGSAHDLVTLPFVQAHTLPGVELAATTVHTGNRDTLPQACRALIAWIESNGYQVAGHYQENTLREGELYEILIPVLKP